MSDWILKIYSIQQKKNIINRKNFNECVDDDIFLQYDHLIKVDKYELASLQVKAFLFKL